MPITFINEDIRQSSTFDSWEHFKEHADFLPVGTLYAVSCNGTKAIVRDLKTLEQWLAEDEQNAKEELEHERIETENAR